MIVFLSIFAHPARAQQQFRAAWADVFHVGMGSTTEVNNMVSSLVAGHYNVVMVQVVAFMDGGSSSHGALYKSSILPWSTRVTSSFDPLAYLCQQAHANGIEVHAWLGGSGGGMYRVSTSWPPSGNSTLAAHPEWFMVPYTNSESGAISPIVDGSNKYYLLDMGSSDAQEYIVSIVRELVTNYQIDGINWDDELDGPEYPEGLGFPAYSQAAYPRSGLARYRNNTGYVGTPSATDPTYDDYRRRFKNELIARCQAEIQSIKTNPRQPLRHTLSPIAYSPVPPSCDFTKAVPYTNYCDWAGMLQHGWIDAAIPQFYATSTYNTWIDRSVSCWQYNRQVFPGIGAYLTTDANIVTEMNYAFSKGLNGCATYSYAVANNSATPSDWWAYAAANIFTNAVSTPPMTWRSPATATEGIIWGRVKDTSTGLYVDDAVVTVSGATTVRTDGNGYYVASLVPATAAGTAYSVTASKSSMNAVANATALAGDIVRCDLSFTATPSAPSGLTATAVGLSEIDLAWTDNSTNESNFVVARGTSSGGPYTDIATVAANTTNYNNTGLSPSTSYYYVVRATNAAGASPNSGEASATTFSIPAPPNITTQPQSQTVSVGSPVSFSVSASGSQPLSYQWFFNNSTIVNATNSSYSIVSAQLSNAGDYFVRVTNLLGATTSSVATLTVVIPVPTITTQPQDQAIIVGQTATFTVSASSPVGLSYQWKWNGTNIAGATKSSLVFTNVATNQAGSYGVAVSNAGGTTNSASATLTVYPHYQFSGWSLLWKLGAGARPYLTSATNPTERGMVYDALNNRVMVVSRSSGGNIYVLNGDTGADLYKMTIDTNLISAGTYPLLMVAAADDGAIFAANLTTDAANIAFRLYRWANDNSNTLPTLVYSGNPNGTTGLRWGDTIAARGAGTNTQVIVASRTNGIVMMFTTTNGTTFTPHLINLPGAAGDIGLGLAFGLGDTFWGKTRSTPLRQVGFDLTSNTATLLYSYTNNFPSNISPIGVNAPYNLLAGIFDGVVDNLQLFDLTLTNGAPVLLGTNTFGTANTNGFFTGAVDFGNDRVYALDSNNGLLAMKLYSVQPLVIQSIAQQPSGQFRMVLSASYGTNYWIERSYDLANWQTITNVVATNDVIDFTDSSPTNVSAYYRARQ